MTSYDLKMKAVDLRRTKMLLLPPNLKEEAYITATTNWKEETMLSLLPTEKEKAYVTNMK